jgi:hypothetical protein
LVPIGEPVGFLKKFSSFSGHLSKANFSGLFLWQKIALAVATQAKFTFSFIVFFQPEKKQENYHNV